MESVHKPGEHIYDSVYSRLNRENQTAAPVVDKTQEPQATETVVVNQKLIYIVAIIVILSFLVTIATSVISALTMTSGCSSSTGKRTNSTSYKNVSASPASLHDNKLIVTTAY